MRVKNSLWRQARWVLPTALLASGEKMFYISVLIPRQGAWKNNMRVSDSPFCWSRHFWKTKLSEPRQKVIGIRENEKMFKGDHIRHAVEITIVMKYECLYSHNMNEKIWARNFSCLDFHFASNKWQILFLWLPPHSCPGLWVVICPHQRAFLLAFIHSYVLTHCHQKM